MAVTNLRRRPGTRVKDLALLSASHAVTHVQPTLYPLVYPYVMQALGFGYAQLGALVAVAGLAGGVLQGVHGYLARWVRRRVLCGAGNVLFGLTLGLSGLAGSFPLFSGLRVLASAATSPQHPIASSLLADWYPREKRGAAFAVHFSGGNLGTVLTPLVAGAMLAHLGWRATLAWFALPPLVVGALVWALTDDRRPGDAFREPASHLARRPYLAAARNREVLIVVAGRALTAGGRGLGIVLTYVPLYLVRGLHLPPATAGAYVSVLALGSVVAPLIAGAVADRLGARKPVVLASLWLSAAATLGLARPGAGASQVLAALALLGLAVYNESSLLQALLADLVSEEERDGAFSLYFVVSYAGAALWAVVIGVVIARWHFAAGFAVMVASYVLASAVLGLVRERPAAA